MSNMVSAPLLSIPTPSYPSISAELPNVNFSASKRIKSKLVYKNEEIRSTRSSRCSCSPRSGANYMTKSNAQNPSFSGSCLMASTNSFEAETSGVVVADKLQRLVLEFKSLREPIDRVKRLLQYAALLPPLEESVRLPENRVRGCATQVWLVSQMDKCGRMRFKADSDSEISRGFCSCLIWILDGAEPEEILMVETEDLVHMNVGLYGKAQSRVNTWHNVLLSMQKATKALILETRGKPPLETLPTLIVTADDIRQNEIFMQQGYPFYAWLSLKLAILQPKM